MTTPDTATPQGGAPTLDAMAERLDSYEPLAKWLFERSHPSKSYDESMRVWSPDVRENWLKVARNTAPTLVAALSRLSGPAADDAGLKKAITAYDEARSQDDAQQTDQSDEAVADALEDLLLVIRRIARPFNAALSTLPAAAGGDPTPAVDERPVQIFYTNWRDEKTLPTIIPTRVFWGSNEWHPEPCWLLEATDVSKQATRTYDIRKIGRLADHQARPAAPEGAYRVPAELRALSDAASPGPWCYRNNKKGLPWIGDDPSSQNSLVIVQKEAMYRGAADYLFVAKLVTWFRQFCDNRTSDSNVSKLEIDAEKIEGLVRRVEAALLCDLKDEVRSRFCREFVAALAPSAPAGGVEAAVVGDITEVTRQAFLAGCRWEREMAAPPPSRPTAPVDRVREAAEAAFSAWLGDKYGSDVLADAMGDLRAALSRLSGPAADAAGLVDAVRAALNAMRSVTVFVTTRERIKSPEGEDWWSAQIAALEAALPASGEALFTPAYGEWLCKPPLKPILDAAEVAETDDEILDDFALALTAENPARNELRDARQAVLSRMKGTSR